MDSLPWVMLWFVLTGNRGNPIPPMQVRQSDSIMQCGISGKVVGIQIDKLENPTQVFWPDFYNPMAHCSVDITIKVASLPDGEYHLATTGMGVVGGKPYIQHDPHTSVRFMKSSFNQSKLPKIINVRVQ